MTSEATPEQTRAFINMAKAMGEAWELDEPHAIIETDPINGSQQVHGPFPDAHQAILGAVTLTERAPRDHEKPYPTYTVCLSFTREQSGL